jgi:hypothetical protein
MTIVLVLIIIGYTIYKYGAIRIYREKYNVFTVQSVDGKRQINVEMVTYKNVVSRKTQWALEICRINLYKETVVSDQKFIIEDLFVNFSQAEANRFIERYFNNRDEKAKRIDSGKHINNIVIQPAL